MRSIFSPTEMYLTHLSLTNFRAFTRLDMDVPRRILLLVGDNAQGKTSLLEAVYFLATFSSILTDSDRQLINFSSLNETLVFSRLAAEFVRGGQTHRLEARLILDPVATAAAACARKSWWMGSSAAPRKPWVVSRRSFSCPK